MKAIKAEDTRSLESFRDRIIEGDCLEVMKGIPGESIDMILCDLPYGTTQNKWDSIYQPRPALYRVHAHHQTAWRYRLDKQRAFYREADASRP